MLIKYAQIFNKKQTIKCRQLTVSPSYNYHQLGLILRLPNEQNKDVLKKC